MQEVYGCGDFGVAYENTYTQKATTSHNLRGFFVHERLFEKGH